MVNYNKGVFDRGITYIVEPNPVGYTIHKTTGDGKTAYVALDKIDTGDWLDTLYAVGQSQVSQDGVIVTTPYTPLYTNPATITQGTPNGLAFAGSVTIKSDDTYTPAAWDAVVANVITALNAAYEAGNGATKDRFETTFGISAGAEIVLVNNLANNWEVRQGEFRTLYLKTGSIATANYGNAVREMVNETPNVGNAAPPKRRAFLALGIKPLNCVILTHLTQNRANLLILGAKTAQIWVILPQRWARATPTLGKGNPNVGQNYPNVGQNYPNVWVGEPKPWAKGTQTLGKTTQIGIDQPQRLGRTTPTLGKDNPNVGQNYPNV